MVRIVRVAGWQEVPQVSVQGEIYGYLQSLAGDSNGVIPFTAEGVAAQTGFSRDKVSRVVFNLVSRGKVEAVRGPNGRSIIGLRHLQPAEDGRRTRRNGHAPARPTEPTVSARRVLTPHIDEYERKKTAFRRLMAELEGYVTATFDDNPIAEEALLLRARLDAVEPGYQELRKKLDESERNLKYMRGRHKSEIAESVAKAELTLSD